MALKPRRPPAPRKGPRHLESNDEGFEYEWFVQPSFLDDTHCPLTLPVACIVQLRHGYRVAGEHATLRLPNANVPAVLYDHGDYVQLRTRHPAPTNATRGLHVRDLVRVQVRYWATGVEVTVTPIS